MTNTIEDRLVDVEGTYFDILSKVNAETIQHADQIMNARRTNVSMRGKTYWTADFPLYVIEEGDVILYLARLEFNPIILNPQRALGQMLGQEFYIPTPEELDKVRKSKRSVRVNTSKIYMESCSDGQCGVSRFYNDADFESFNENEKALIERVWGRDREFEINMRLLRRCGVYATGFHLVNPDWIRGMITEERGAGFTSYLQELRGDSYFIVQPIDMTKFKETMRAVELVKRT